MSADFASTWERLPLGFSVALAEAWRSLVAGGLPVGAALTRSGAVLARGRNRVYDPPGGADPLQGTPIAHAEMNALATAGREIDPPSCAMWTTHSPCAMCTAALELADVAVVNFLGSDPSDDVLPSRISSSGGVDDVWSAVATAMFLHNVAAVAGRSHRMIENVRGVEPALVDLALGILDDATWADVAREGGDVSVALEAVWPKVSTAQAARG